MIFRLIDRIMAAVAECGVEPIGLAVQQGCDKPPALGLSQVDLDVSPGTLELVYHRLQRVPLPISS